MDDLQPLMIKTDTLDNGLDKNVDGLNELMPGDWEDGRGKLVKICKKLFKRIDHKLCDIAGMGRRFNTPVTVKFLATEGMRTYNRLNGAGDDALMRTIRSQCKLLCEKYRYTFLAAEILHGKLEAMGAWVDANCHYPNQDGTPVGIMEVGGASMQIMNRPGSDGVYCNASFGKDAAMRTIVEKLNEIVVKNLFKATKRQAELKKELSVLTKKSRRKHTTVTRNPFPASSRPRSPSSKKPKRIQKLKAELKKLQDGSNCPWDFVKWTGKAREHPIFKEGHEKQLKKLINDYLFTADNIEEFRSVTEKRQEIEKTTGDRDFKRQLSTRNLKKIRSVAQVVRGAQHLQKLATNKKTTKPRRKRAAAKTAPSSSEDSVPPKKLGQDPLAMLPLSLERNMTTDPRQIDSADIEIMNEKIRRRQGKRNYLLACSFQHLEAALAGVKEARENPNIEYNFFDFIEGIDVPTFTAKAKKDYSEFIPSNRFMFFFAKKLYEVLKDNIDITDTRIEKEINWTRGIAIMQTFDKTNNTELNGEELRDLIQKMREAGFCENFLSML